MNAPTSELTRMIKLRPLPGGAVIVEADAAERAALASRFDLSSVESLRVDVALAEDGKAVRATGTLDARIIQACAISGEDFEVDIHEPLDLKFVEEGTLEQAVAEEEEIEIELAADDCDEIEYSGDTFDLGEAIAQTLGLAIDPYAEGPNADAAREAAGIRGDDVPSGPLADALAALKKE